MEKMWSCRFGVKSLELRVQSKKFKVLKVILLTFNFLLFLTACQSNPDKKAEGVAHVQYTCPMHPQIIKDAPGSCPICGMDLVKLNPEEVHVEIDAELKDLIQPTNQAIVSNIKTIHPAALNLADTILLDGKVSYDTQQIKTVSSRFGGRIEQLFVKYNFQKVSKGQKIMTIYSPEIAAAQQELLYLKNQGDLSLLENAKQKLRLLGIDNQQINQILRTGKVNYQIPVYSPYSGYVIDSQMDKSLNDMSQNSVNQETSALSFLEGQYLKTGDMIFKVFNDSQVWALFYANAAQQASIKENQKVRIVKGNTIIPAQVNLVQPYYDQGQPFSKIRVELNNSDHQFHIGELLQAKIILPATDGLWLPESAVYKLGERKIVFIKKDAVLTAKEVQTGITSAHKIQIINGLNADDEIAENAAYLIDTESFIQVLK